MPFFLKPSSTIIEKFIGIDAKTDDTNKDKNDDD